MKQEKQKSVALTSPPRGEVGAKRRVRGKAPNSISKARILRRKQTEAEKTFWYLVRNRQLGGHKFVRQFPISPYIVDFICRQEKLIVELDGGQHAESQADEKRTRFLNNLGYSVLRFWNNEILQNKEGCYIAMMMVLEGSPSPDLRFAPATLSPEGRGEEVNTHANGRN